MSGTQKKGKKYTEKEFIRVTIWCTPSEWERMNYLSASTGKSLSAWVVDEILNSEDNPVITEQKKKIENGEVGKVKPLCVEKYKWEKIKKYAEQSNMSISRYVIQRCVK